MVSNLEIVTVADLQPGDVWRWLGYDGHIHTLANDSPDTRQIDVSWPPGCRYATTHRHLPLDRRVAVHTPRLPLADHIEAAARHDEWLGQTG